MNWNIVTDSSCDLYELEKKYENISFSSVPFSICVGDKEYIDDENLNVDELVAAMGSCKTAAKTACPSPDAWRRQFEAPGNVIAITITSNLSGSYNSACTAQNIVLEEDPDKKIAVIDSLSAGPELVLIIRKLCEYIEDGMEFDEIMESIGRYMKTTHLTFALCSFDNLIKNGRMKKLKGIVASTLGFWGLGVASDVGTVDMKGIARGNNKAIQMILDDMRERGVPKEHVIISHCQNQQFAETLKEAIIQAWANVKVTIMPTRGLCSIYAERCGLLVAF